MNLIKSIYNTPFEVDVSEKVGCVIVYIKHNGLVYSGMSCIHDEDSNFFSEKVGFTIALSRARISILEDELKKAREKYENKIRYYDEVLGYGAKIPAEVDPTGAFKQNIDRAESHIRSLRSAIKSEKASLRNYLDGHTKAIESVKRFREKDNNS
jgi:hypothetical protein